MDYETKNAFLLMNQVMVLLKDWAGLWLHHRTVEAGNLPVSADNKNQRMFA